MTDPHALGVGLRDHGAFDEATYLENLLGATVEQDLEPTVTTFFILNDRINSVSGTRDQVEAFKRDQVLVRPLLEVESTLTVRRVL